MSDDVIIINNDNRRKKWLWFLIPLSVLLVICVGVLVWHLIPKEYDRINIVNNEQLNSIGGAEIDSFRLSLLHMLEGQSLIEKNGDRLDVAVRDGSVKRFRQFVDGKEQVVANFIIDIDSLEQTYDVTVYKNDELSEHKKVAIKCPKVDVRKYDDACVGVDGNANKSVELFLPYEMKLVSDERVLVKKLGYNEKGLLDLQIYLYSCDEKNPPVVEAQNAVRKWVESLGDPIAEFYTYNIRTGYCEGDAI